MTQKARRIQVSLKANPYEVVIGGKGLQGLGEELLNINVKKGTKVLVVSNSVVAEHYSSTCLSSLSEAGYETNFLIIEAGEDQKTPENVALIHDAAFSASLERGSLMIALGGGVVGDITGFAASTWLRGISVIQIPTTLLSMVDASIGGKTGVNHKGGKNLIGAFHQPSLVLIDPSTLKTLPENEYRAGMAEVIKYGVIGDIRLFRFLEDLTELNTPSRLTQSHLLDILESSTSAKADMVCADEKESGIRAYLNYGHTFGHVIETLCGYGNWLHGEAVAIGMVAAGELAVQRNNWSKEEAIRQQKLISKAGLPTRWPKLNVDDVIKTLQGDKKVKHGKIRFVLPKAIGKVEIYSDVSIDEIKLCLSTLTEMDFP